MATRKKTPPAEIKELNKIIRLFALKVVQIVVQSRIGTKLRTYCKPITYANDYFGIAINDIPDVLTESKRILDNGLIINRLPLSIEISVKTVDGNMMVLENWMLSLVRTTTAYDEKAIKDLHHRMGALLKSILSITRVLPSYKISRNQDPSSYTIYYKLNTGDFDEKQLGDNHKVFNLSKICLGRKTLCMTVLYRTRMVFASQPIRISKMLEDDPEPVKKPKRIIDFSIPMKAGAFVDPSTIKEFTDANFEFPEENPYSWLLELAQDDLNCEYMKMSETEEVATGEEANESIKVSGDDADQKDDDKDFKFMKELNCPFATESPFTELAKFYRDFFFAPSLKEFDEMMYKNSPPPKECTSCSSHEDVANELKKLENSLPEYDQMVTNLCQFSNEYI